MLPIPRVGLSGRRFHSVVAAAGDVELEPLDAPYRITAAANVRAAPDVAADCVSGLRAGERVTALGKVRGKDWYLVERDGERLGFVFGRLLEPAGAAPQEQAANTTEPRRDAEPAPILTQGRRIALVIGNGSYIGQAPPLENPPNDAALMKRTLEASGFEVIQLIDADQREMRRAISSFAKRLTAAGEEAVGLFFYAGHGVQVDGTNYLIPIGAQIEIEPDIKVEAVDANSVLGAMNFAGNRLNFMILDACRNNPYPQASRGGPTTRGLSQPNVDVARGVLVAYSTGPDEVALDGATGNSPYTLALAEAMFATRPGGGVDVQTGSRKRP